MADPPQPAPDASHTRHAALRRLARRRWRRLLALRERFRFSEETLHLGLAGAVGVIGGLVNLFFYAAIEVVQHLFLGRPGDPVEIAETLGPWARLLTPTIGGLLAGLVLYLGIRFVGRQRSSNILEVVVAGDGRLPFRTGLVKFFSSLLTVGTGGSIGREGAIVELSATLSSKWGQLARWPPYRLRLLVGCGAASGIAAAYNAPISGAVFAALIVLGNFSMNLFAPLVFSSVVATMVSRNFFGIHPWYSPPSFDFTSVAQLPWFLLLGVVGSIFLKLLSAASEAFLKLPLPIYLRLMLGGLLVGVIAVGFPGVWGNGYEVTNRILNQDFLAHPAPLLFVLSLLGAKLLATVATVGSGAVGGVFTPTLFIGASVGASFGLGLQELGAVPDMPPAVFAVVGMGGLLAATTRSPLLAMIMVFEISLDYSIMPPLMLASVVAILVAQRIHGESIYTEPLRLKGLRLIRESTHTGVAMQRTVGDLMQEPVRPVQVTTTLNEIGDRFLTTSINFLPVVDGEERLVGLIALQDLKEYLGGGDDLGVVIAWDVMRPPPECITPDRRLVDVLPIVVSSEQRRIPVVSSCEDGRMVGALARAEVLNLFSEAIAEGSTPAGRLHEGSLWG